MKTKGALLWEPGTRSGWSVEEIELDPPKADEALVKLAASGVCHSDDHLDTGDLPLSWAPILGGHEGAGIVQEVGPGVTSVEVGDHVVLSFLPSCGKCRYCTTGRPSICDRGAGVLGGTAPDGTCRIHARGKDVGAMSYLGTFSPYVVAPATSIVKIDKSIPLDKAALIGCGVPTGWGSAVYAGNVGVGDIVVVVGVGGVGMNAVQGARMAGASVIVAVDPVELKREHSMEFGATHVAADFDAAAAILAPMTNGQGADVVIFTVGVAHGELVQPAADLTAKGGTLVITSAAPALQSKIDLNLLGFIMSSKRLQGTLYGSTNAGRDIPLLTRLYQKGDLMLDELITRRYALEDINQAFQDMHDGKNIRGLIVYDEEMATS